MEHIALVDNNNIDEHVDNEISEYLSLDNPKSFFLFAGAGSGKTRSLVKALKQLRESSAKHLRLHGQKIGVITYTNNACDEIKGRLDFDPLIEVATIHSFVWSLISGFNSDIKEWLKTNLPIEIANIEVEQRNSKAVKMAQKRKKSIERKQKRLADLNDVKKFKYNPSGDNYGRDSLNHTEMIRIGADFLMQKPLMQRIFVNKYPILLIDESQDTNKLLIDAFFEVQHQHKDRFALGLFGDTMQRIYGEGKENLGQNLPADWATPAKIMNHRCPPRIIELINKIRSDVDDLKQQPRNDAEKGFARLFILPIDTIDKHKAESKVIELMANVTDDLLWHSPGGEVKTLTLEHHMAARRLGFLQMFEPLYKNEKLKTGLLDGTLPGVRLFSQLVLPIVEANKKNDKFSIMSILRKNSPLLSKAAFKDRGNEQLNQIKITMDAIAKLLTLWKGNNEPCFLDVLNCIAEWGLFEIPDSLQPFVSIKKIGQETTEMNGENPSLDDNNSDSALEAWDNFLLTPFEQIKPYAVYISGQSQFGTHHGVKGLEFPRVMIIIDDNEARGKSLFSYDKILGSKDKTATDMQNEKEGKDTSIKRTLRLFYVTCSRTEKSLAIIVYSDSPEKIRNRVLSKGWFKESEVEILTKKAILLE
ncbi:MAG: ATP-dependent helicase [Nitrospirae bacterium]|nr:ATP-dependent helicase [Nitrospirota bacterium]